MNRNRRRAGDLGALVKLSAAALLTAACAATTPAPAARPARAEGPPSPRAPAASPVTPTPVAPTPVAPAPADPLEGFYRALRGARDAPVRVVQLGDSHTEDGTFVARVQACLRTRFGDGVTVEGLGVVGARAAQLAARDWGAFGPELAARAPALVVLQYGTNEAASRRADPRALEETLVALAARVRAHVPGCSLVVLGPPDLARRDGERWVTAPALDAVIAAERRAAARAGAFFFDARDALRPEGTIDDLARARPRLAWPDHIHLTPRGYALLADRYVYALLAGFDRRRAPPP